MGISAEQFWQSSNNGKAMVIMLARQSHVEMVRDICDWLVKTYRDDLIVGAMQQGATVQQARLAAENAVASLEATLGAFNDRNAEAAAVQVIDAVFHKHYRQGAAQYERAMVWLAGQLRQRLK